MIRSVAPGGPGLAPRWTRGAKEAVGTAYSAASHVWYTVAAGILTEVFYPTIDTPQIRDLQFLVTDGATFFNDERRNTRSEIACLDGVALGFEIVNVAQNGLYTIRKTLIGAPHHDCVLMRTSFEAAPEIRARLRAYLLCAPHLQIGGWHNNAEILDTKGGPIIVAFKGDTWMALGATAPILRRSCGYVAVNDGWTDLHDNLAMDWEYDAAYDGNIAVTAEIDIARPEAFTVGLAFGDTRHRAITNLFQPLVIPFESALEHFRGEWKRTAKRFALAAAAGDGSALYERSVNLLLAHEDKSYPGAIIAAMSIPWGSSKGDEDMGGYHLVWTRDLVQAATALLAAGDTVTPLRALVYLAISQREDGGFYQNFWIDGRPYWTGVQLDEVSFPVVLAWRLREAGVLGGFDPLAMVAAACGFLIREGPVTAQDRWEEASGFSPSTLAINIAALVCGAALLEAAGERTSAEFVGEYADFLETHIERWTVTGCGTLLPDVVRHYVRINPNADGLEDPDRGRVVLANQPPGGAYAFHACEIVDAGFLELVRYGIRRPDDPLIVDSLRVVDGTLKVETPGGPCWKRYTHDGYGQHDDGTSYKGWGVGRPWPLLTGERGHYELAAGRDPQPYLQALEHFAVGIGLIPEQIWDGEPVPDKLLRRGGPTGAALPLVWAHAEYIKLVRSAADGRVFDAIEPVAKRYLRTRTGQVPRAEAASMLEVWSVRRPIAAVPPGSTLRIVSGGPFTLEWRPTPGVERQLEATATKVSVWYVDLPTARSESIVFRFVYEDGSLSDQYTVAIGAGAARLSG